MLENHEADHVIGDPNMPYLTSLASQYGVATDYFGVTHTSEPNYIAATSGDNWWVNNDNGWNTSPRITTTTPTSSTSCPRRTSRGPRTCRRCRQPATWPATGG